MMAAEKAARGGPGGSGPGRGQSEVGRAVVRRIHRLMRERGLAQSDLAARAGMFTSRLSKWWQGEGEPTVDHVVRVARALGCSAAELIGEPAPAPRPASDDPELALLLDLIGRERGKVRPDRVIKLLFDAIRSGAIPPEDAEVGEQPRPGIVLPDAGPIGPNRPGPRPGMRLDDEGEEDRPPEGGGRD